MVGVYTATQYMLRHLWRVGVDRICQHNAGGYVEWPERRRAAVPLVGSAYSHWFDSSTSRALDARRAYVQVGHESSTRVEARRVRCFFTLVATIGVGRHRHDTK